MSINSVVLLGFIAVLLSDIPNAESSCPTSNNGLALSGFTISNSAGTQTSISRSGGTYTFSGTVTVSSPLAGLSSVNVAVTVAGSVQMTVVIVSVSYSNYNFCTLSSSLCPSYTGATCSSMQTLLDITGVCSSDNSIAAASHSFSHELTVPNMTNLSGGISVTSAEPTVKVEVKNSSNSVVGCIEQSISIS